MLIDFHTLNRPLPLPSPYIQLGFIPCLVSAGSVLMKYDFFYPLIVKTQRGQHKIILNLWFVAFNQSSARLEGKVLDIRNDSKHLLRFGTLISNRHTFIQFLMEALHRGKYYSFILFCSLTNKSK